MENPSLKTPEKQHGTPGVPSPCPHGVQHPMPWGLTLDTQPGHGHAGEKRPGAQGLSPPHGVKQRQLFGGEEEERAPRHGAARCATQVFVRQRKPGGWGLPPPRAARTASSPSPDTHGRARWA